MRHSGTSTIRSRGTDTAVTLFWRVDRCSRIAVSDRCVPASLPYAALPSPERVSDPMTRMFVPPRGTGDGRSRSYRLSSATAVSSVVMFRSSFR